MRNQISYRDLMMNCLVAQFRCNHRNSHIFNVCLDPNSPTVFRVAFVDAMYTVVQEVITGYWGLYMAYICGLSGHPLS